MSIKTYIYIIAVFILSSCEKEDINYDINIKENEWVVSKIKTKEDLVLRTTSSTYILKFIDDIQYTINLDVNSCGGNYTNFGNGSIKIEPAGCTEICCDSEYAEDLIQILSTITKYYGKGNELILEGDGKIILFKKD